MKDTKVSGGYRHSHQQPGVQLNAGLTLPSLTCDLDNSPVCWKAGTITASVHLRGARAVVGHGDRVIGHSVPAMTGSGACVLTTNQPEVGATGVVRDR
ncbi:MAG: hypothetical protein IPO77_21905 [Acidobacteria bacterium]|nr:hypothetical protein [Acidobacteriota bacterium]